ncbi:hypothetical protein VSS37_06170 [Candidatus Thiothrix sp. Deng01]|uniref:Uncharacterized protein n=1 Tax=Candidatus Thiothrix phosphatis TaxID=3112415 RepID=A0ABU6CUP7_9GAMM|nr:hypothetical protein [Candidatus Thiothrix sp. Deng01]MEB4590559.1 hypothetical protein [Candidatus Thiothrix sp. Deng01]
MSIGVASAGGVGFAPSPAVEARLPARLAKELHAFRDFGQFERAAQGAVKVSEQAGAG